MRRGRLICGGFAGCVLFAMPAAAWAYIDPGTQTQVVQILFAVLGTIGLCFGMLLWPFKRVLWWARDRFGRRTAWAILVGAVAIVAGVVVFVVFYFFGARHAEVIVPDINPNLAEQVIVIGMDGLDPGVMEEMMAEGDLPNFARLRRDGTFSRMQTSIPPETPVAWSSIATGVNPGRHGLFDFLHRDPKTYRPILSIYKVNTSNVLDKREKRYLPVRGAPGFWTFATKRGARATVIRWPTTFPPEPVTGRFLSGIGVPDVAGRLGRHTLFTTEETAPPSFKGRWCSAQWKDGAVTAALVGPVVAGLTGRKEAELALVIRRKGAAEVSIQVADSPEFGLAVGQWSEYIPVHFKPGWGKTVPAMVRFYLGALEPHLRLYASTPELDPAEPYFPFTWPDGYAAELVQAIGRYTTLGMPEDVNAMKDGSLSPEAFLAAMANLFRERKAQFDREFAEFERHGFRGVFAFVFDASDRIQHMFWQTRDPGHPAWDAEFARKFGHVIPDMYRQMDGVLGEVLARVDAFKPPPGASNRPVVIVVSDHGFNTFRTSVGLNSWLVENGYMVLNTPGGRNGRELFADVNWSKTRAYSVGFTSIYVNQRGRERDGIVQAADSAALCAEIAAKLRALADPVTGKPVVRNVYIARDVYRGKFAADGPDLVVGFHAGYRAEDTNVIGGAPVPVFADNMSLWSGDHLMDAEAVPAMFASNRKLSGAPPRAIDIAPTILRCLGIEPRSEMDGRALFSE